MLPPDKMARVLADIHIGESVIESDRKHFSTDSMKKALKQSIYIKNGVTAAQVDTSLAWYGYHMEKYVEVYDKVIELLEADIVVAQERAGAASERPGGEKMELEGDSVDVWPELRMRRFSTLSPTDIITFSLSSDRHWEKGDYYTLAAKLIRPSSRMDATIVVQYQDGTTDYTSGPMGEGWSRLTLSLDTAKQARRVFGYMQYTPRDGEETIIDSIQLVRTRFDNPPRTGVGRRQSFANAK